MPQPATKRLVTEASLDNGPADTLVAAKIAGRVDPLTDAVATAHGRAVAITRRQPRTPDPTLAGVTIAMNDLAAIDVDTSPITNGHFLVSTDCGRFSTGKADGSAAVTFGNKGRWPVRPAPANYGDTDSPFIWDTMVSDPDGDVVLQVQAGLTGTNFIEVYVDDVLVLREEKAYVADKLWRIPITFTRPVAAAHIRLVTSLGVHRVWCGPHGRAYKPTVPIFVGKFLGIGDSFMSGNNDAAYPGSSGGYLARISEFFRLEWKRASGSGTGLTTDGGGASGKNTYPDRITAALHDTYVGDVDFCMLQLSTNDSAATQSQIETAMAAFVINWRTHFDRPDGSVPPIFVIGVARGIPNGPSAAACNIIDNGATAVMNANPDLFPTPLAPTTDWWTGNGYIGVAATTTPKGTTETGISGDGVHPSADGHTHMAWRLVDPLAQFLSAIGLPVA